MKWLIVFALFIVAPLSLAQAPAPASPAPVVAPVPAPAVAVPQVAAPPAWVSEFLQTVSALPIVGPYISKILLYVGILGMLLTALVTFLLSVAQALKGVANLAGLASAVTWLQNFQQSKWMYWLTSVSNIPVNSTPAGKAAAAAAKAQT